MSTNKQSRHQVQGVGDVLVVRRNGTRRMSIRIRPFEPVRCLVPANVTAKQALKFVEKNRGWINRQRNRIDDLEERRTVFDEETDFKTRFHSLQITREGAGDPSLRIVDRKIRVNVPPDREIRSTAIQEAIRKSIERALRKEATAVLPYRLAALARQNDLSYAGVSLRAQRRRWGSCSSTNRINLNIHLMRLPDTLIDYVLLHELAHTKHKNHSKTFWAYLDGLSGGNARALDRALRTYSPTIY